MARAAAIAHPQSLDRLGRALNLPLAKDMEGHKLMMKMARPRRFNADGTITWWDDPQDVDRLMEYCGRDIDVEAMAHLNLPPLTEKERAVWAFDQEINDRGVLFDMPAVRVAASLVDYAKKQNDRVMRELTDRAVPKCSNDKKIMEWLNGRGVTATSLAKGEVENVVFMAETARDQAAHDVIMLRQGAWKTSTAKYVAMDKCVSSDDRIRGMLNYHGAATGRWAGRLVQPQNFPRLDNENEYLVGQVKFLHQVLASGDVRYAYDMLEAVYGPLEVLNILSKALRSMIKAPEGKRLIGGDFSNIEGRANAWLAGEHWKLRAFQEYDDGTGPDLYKLAYARSFGVDVGTVGKGPQRQMGKVQELALGYQGGIGAFLQMGATYGLNPFDLSGPVQSATSAEQWDQTAARFHAPGAKRMDLQEREWCALQVLVDNWRSANPAIVQSWWNYQDAAVEAVAAPGHLVHPQHTKLVGYYSDGRCLWCLLPSGRMLCYAAPLLVEEYKEYFDRRTGETRTRLTRKVTYEGTDSRTRQWVRSSLYGGLQCENIVQAVARDLMVDAMFRVEAAGYPIILTVHDEVLSEVDKHVTHLNEHDFARVMSITDPVYEGLPISVGAWEDERYVK